MSQHSRHPADTRQCEKTGTREERGFTLIEILIVVGIIAALASMFLPKYLDVQKRSDLAIAKAELATLRTSIVIYKQDTGTYPNGTDDITTTADWNNFLLTDPGVLKWKGPYTDRVTEDPWGQPFVFGNHFDETSGGDPISYVMSSGPNAAVDTTDFSVDAPGGDDIVVFLEGQKGAGGGGL
jgi:general secretion pathway protein G